MQEYIYIEVERNSEWQNMCQIKCQAEFQNGLKIFNLDMLQR